MDYAEYTGHDFCEKTLLLSFSDVFFFWHLELQRPSAIQSY